MENVMLIIGISMIVIGLALGIYITIKIVEEGRARRDEPID